MPKTGVMLLAFGGPTTLDDVGPFMCNLTGREPSPEAIERVRSHYEVCGGGSPLPAIADRLAGLLTDALAARGFGEVPVRAGMRYWHPFIADSLAELAALGCERVVWVSLSPFESSHASGTYRSAVLEAAGAHPGVAVAEAPSFREVPAFVEAFAASCRGARALLPEGARVATVFTAHSLPADEIAGDPYVEQLRDSASAVAARCGLDPAAASGGQEWLPGVDAFGSVAGDGPWLLAYQSKGMRPGAWIGPDLGDVIAALSGGAWDGLAVVPIGFATEHMETAYDLDVVAARAARDASLAFARALTPSDSAEMAGVLAEVVAPLL